MVRFSRRVSPKGLSRIVLLAILLVLCGLVIGYRQAVADWFRLRGYTPTPAVQGLVTADTMTSTAQHLFYINRPVIVAKQEFGSDCSMQPEQTIVLGCYHGNESGIYVLRITSDPRLKGVMQVTAAHEMLHAAYDRLSLADRNRVNAWLEQYYQYELTDPRIKKTIDSYKKSEPDGVVDEMHSIFGTEVANLPAPLEHYYQRYFTQRSQVVAMASNYQAEFTSREQQVAVDDAQLTALKQTIEAHEASLRTQQTALQSQANTLQQLRASGQTGTYNSRVDSYNAAVDTYNKLVVTTKAEISTYNDLVAQRNTVAFAQRQLVQELSGGNLSTIK